MDIQLKFRKRTLNLIEDLGGNSMKFGKVGSITMNQM